VRPTTTSLRPEATTRRGGDHVLPLTYHGGVEGNDPEEDDEKK
jgi:hypothetical protein